MYYKSIAIRAVCIHVGADKNTNETEQKSQKQTHVQRKLS